MKKLSPILGVLLALCLLAACTPTPPDGGHGGDTTYFTVTTSFDAERGTVSLSPVSEDGKYEKNTSVTATVTPKADFVLASFTVDGEEKTLDGNSYTFTVTKDIALAATFAPKPEFYTVTLSYNALNGDASLLPVSADSKYEKGTPVTLTVTPESGYTATVTANGAPAALDGDKYSFTVEGNVDLIVQFRKADTSTAKLPKSYYGTYYRETGPDIIVIDDSGLSVSGTLCPVTEVEGVYHTEWEGKDYIVTLNDESFTYGKLRLTYVADGGATEYNFYREDTSRDIVDSARGTWADKAHNVTLVITAKTLTWNGTECTLVIIGENLTYHTADLYFRRDGAVYNLYEQYGKLHVYMEGIQYSFERPAVQGIPDVFYGSYTGTHPATDTVYTLTVDATSVVMNGKTATDIAYLAGDDVLEFYIDGARYAIWHEDDGSYLLEIPVQGGDYVDLTKS